MSQRAGRKWWIIGCLGVLLVIVAGALVVAGLVWWSSRSSEPRTTTLSHTPPAAALSVEGHRTAATLDVLLELDSCEVFVEPAAPGEALSVEAHYDANDYLMEERIDEHGPGMYRLRFLVTSSRLITGIKQGLRGGQPQLRIRLPVDTPTKLRLVQRNGGAVVDLSGLRLVTAEFDVGGAMLKVDADAPLEGDLERLGVIGRQSGLVVESLSLMQPRQLDVDFRMGQIQLDFRGDWESNTAIDLSLGLTDAIVRLPGDAHVEGLNSTLGASLEPNEITRPTLSFDVERGRRTTVRIFE